MRKILTSFIALAVIMAVFTIFDVGRVSASEKPSMNIKTVLIVGDAGAGRCAGAIAAKLAEHNIPFVVVAGEPEILNRRTDKFDVQPITLDKLAVEKYDQAERLPETIQSNLWLKKPDYHPAFGHRQRFYSRFFHKNFYPPENR